MAVWPWYKYHDVTCKDHIGVDRVTTSGSPTLIDPPTPNPIIINDIFELKEMELDCVTSFKM